MYALIEHSEDVCDLCQPARNVMALAVFLSCLNSVLEFLLTSYTGIERSRPCLRTCELPFLIERCTRP